MIPTPILAILLVLIPSIACAELPEQEPHQAAPSPKADPAPAAELKAPRWAFAFRLGSYAAAQYSVAFRQSSQLVASTVAKTQPSLGFGYDFGYLLPSAPGVELFISMDWTNLKSGSGPDDKLFLGQAGVRVQREGPVRLWIAGTVGLLNLTFGQTSGSSGGSTLFLDPSSAGLVYTARLGADVPIGLDQFFLGFEGRYSHLYTEYRATVISGSGTSRVDVDHSAGVFSFFGRAGFRF